jgi:hypothetical protein
MSQWTSVTGAIRFDCLSNDNNSELLEKLKAIFGHTCNEMSTPIEWHTCTIPYGTEGSLQYHIHQYETGMPWVIVSIWGDLRDFDNNTKIINWFYMICEEWRLTRQGVIEISSPTQTITVNFTGN